VHVLLAKQPKQLPGQVICPNLQVPFDCNINPAEHWLHTLLLHEIQFAEHVATQLPLVRRVKPGLQN